MAGVAAILVLTGCQSSPQGHTGLMLSGDGTLYGVVQVCEGSVTSFDLRSGDGRLIEGFAFAEPVTDAASVRLGAVPDVSDVIAQVPAGYFSGGAEGQSDITARLHTPAAAIGQLAGNQVVYADGDALTSVSFDEFAALPCAGD